MRGLTLNGQQEVFRALTPTMCVLTDDEIYDVSGGDPGASSRRLFAYAEAAAAGALSLGADGFAVAGPLGALGFGLLGATYGLAGAGLQTALNQVAWLNIVD